MEPFFLPRRAGLNFPILCDGSTATCEAMRESNDAPASSIELAAALAALGVKTTLPPDPFPQTVSGAWNRTRLRDLPVDESPSPGPRNSVVQIRTAGYMGPGEIEAEL